MASAPVPMTPVTTQIKALWTHVVSPVSSGNIQNVQTQTKHPCVNPGSDMFCFHVSSVFMNLLHFVLLIKSPMFLGLCSLYEVLPSSKEQRMLHFVVRTMDDTTFIEWFINSVQRCLIYYPTAKLHPHINCLLLKNWIHGYCSYCKDKFLYITEQYKDTTSLSSPLD